jgi:SAM-dependent methyltransferase
VLKDGYSSINRRAWRQLAEGGSDSSRPLDRAVLDHAAEWLDPEGWLPWDEITWVLCLAAGGGQQAPAFASLGCRVTLADLTPAQLAIDGEVARREGFDIELIVADMLDLMPLHGRGFDLVYQPVSACYVPDLGRLYGEVRRVLRPGGYYRVEHWNPFQMQLDPLVPWDGSAYRLTAAQRPRKPVALPWWLNDGNGQSRPVMLRHFIHPLQDLIGGLCDARFSIVRCAERWDGDLDAPPGSPFHMAAFVPPFLSMLARRNDDVTP